MQSLYESQVITPAVIAFKHYSRGPRWYGVPVGRPLRAFTRRFRHGLVRATNTTIRGLADGFSA